jgi:hypothetical protein
MVVLGMNPWGYRMWNLEQLEECERELLRNPLSSTGTISLPSSFTGTECCHH